MAVEHEDRAGRPVAVVTDAQRSRVEELRERQRRYLWMMAFRTVFFALAIVLAVYVNTALGIALGIVSCILPWIAVVAANAGPHRPSRPERYIPGPRSELGSADEQQRRD